MKNALVISLYIFIASTLNAQQTQHFRPPMDIGLYLSGNFGEIRSDHFHSGLDFKTQGVSGQKVFAIESGYVSRIKIQAGGYGKALYIDHPGGYTSVYGHLSSYNDIIDDYIRKIQYSRESHQVDIYLKPGEITVMKGDLVAYSGNTGSSSGPHLHFEIRSSEQQIPMNGLFFNMPVKDNIAPEIRSVVVYPAGDVNGQLIPGDGNIFTCVKSGQKYSLSTGNPVEVSDLSAFGIEVYDYLNDVPNRCGVFSIELKVDGVRYYYSEMDAVSFSDTRFVNAHIDYGLKNETGRHVQRMHILPYNNLKIYKDVKNKGFISFNDTDIHNVDVNISDSYGNQSQLSFQVRKKMQADRPVVPASCENYIQYNKEYSIATAGINVQFQPYSFYSDICLDFFSEPGPATLYSDIFSIGNVLVPVHRPFNIEIPVSGVPDKYYDKLCLVTVGENETVYAGGNYSGGKVSGSSRNFGKYAVGIDTVAPVINALNLYHGKNLSDQPGIRFIITDDFSGISEYNGYVDNQWILFEYDPKKNLLVYEFDDRVPISKKNHELELYITDNKGNKAIYHTTFYR